MVNDSTRKQWLGCTLAVSLMPIHAPCAAQGGTQSRAWEESRINAVTAFGQGRYSDAERHYQQAISTYETSPNTSPSTLAAALRHYADLLRTYRAAEAEALERRATDLEQLTIRQINR